MGLSLVGEKQLVSSHNETNDLSGDRLSVSRPPPPVRSANITFKVTLSRESLFWLQPWPYSPFQVSDCHIDPGTQSLMCHFSIDSWKHDTKGLSRNPTPTLRWFVHTENIKQRPCRNCLIATSLLVSFSVEKKPNKQTIAYFHKPPQVVYKHWWLLHYK